MFSNEFIDGVWIGRRHVKDLEIMGTKIGDVLYTYQVSNEEIRLLCVERPNHAPLFYRHVPANRVHQLNRTIPSVLAHIDGKPLSGPGYAFPIIPWVTKNMFEAVRDNAIARNMELPNPLIDTAPVPFGIGIAVSGFSSQYGIECDANFIRTDVLMECVNMVKYKRVEVEDVHHTSTYYCTVLAQYSEVKRRLLTGE